MAVFEDKRVLPRAPHLAFEHVAQFLRRPALPAFLESDDQALAHLVADRRHLLPRRHADPAGTLEEPLVSRHDEVSAATATKDLFHAPGGGHHYRRNVDRPQGGLFVVLQRLAQLARFATLVAQGHQYSAFKVWAPTIDRQRST